MNRINSALLILFGVAWTGFLLYPVFDGDSYIAIFNGQQRLSADGLRFSAAAPFEILLGGLFRFGGAKGVLLLKIATYLLQYLFLYRLARGDGALVPFAASLLAMVGMIGLYATSPFGSDVLAVLVFSGALILFSPNGSSRVALLLTLIATVYLGGKCLTSSAYYRVDGGSQIFTPAVLALFTALTFGTGSKRGVLLLALTLLGWIIYALSPFLLVLGIRETGLALAKPTRAQITQGILLLRARLSALPALGSIWILGCIVVVNFANLLRGEPFSIALFPRTLLEGLSGRAQSSSPLVLAPPELGSYLQFRGYRVAVTGETKRSDPNSAITVAQIFTSGDIAEVNRLDSTIVIARAGDKLTETLRSSDRWESIPPGREDGFWRGFKRK